MNKRRRPTQAELIGRLQRALQVKMPASVLADLSMAHNGNLDTIASGQADEVTLWQYVGGLLQWSRCAERIGAGVPEMVEQLAVGTRLVERYARTGRVIFDGPDYQLAKDGVIYMDQIAEAVDRRTAIAAAEWAEAECYRMQNEFRRAWARQDRAAA